MTGASLAAAGIFAVILAVKCRNLDKQAARCTDVTEGEVRSDDIEEGLTEEGRYYQNFRHGVTYTYKGREYTVCAVSGGRLGLPPGTRVTVYVNPYYPREAYVPAFGQRRDLMRGYGLAILAVLLAGLVF